MKTGLMVVAATLLSMSTLVPDAQARDRDERQSTYSEGRGNNQTHHFHRDTVRPDNGNRDHYRQRDDRRGQDYYDRRDNDDRRDRDRHHDRDRDDRVYYRDQHRHYRDYDPYPRHVVVERRYHHPRRVIYQSDRWGHHRYYYVSDDYWEHYYDHAFYRHGRHLHTGCHYHGFFDALATGIVIGAVIGDW